MALITGKTIYILGAGASYHTGAPLLKDFLARARSLMASDSQLVYRESFENLFKWIDRLRAPAYYLEIDLDNLEHIFSLISMMQEVEDPDGDDETDEGDAKRHAGPEPASCDPANGRREPSGVEGLRRAATRSNPPRPS
mgnify:CR=1 FL=1